jgi:hypothetical protein
MTTGNIVESPRATANLSGRVKYDTLQAVVAPPGQQWKKVTDQIFWSEAFWFR